MSTKKRMAIATFISFIILPTFIVILFLLGFKKCNSELEKNDTTLIEQIGRDLSGFKEEFEKGLNYVDSTKVDNDTLNIKK